MKICIDPLFIKTKNAECQYYENSSFHVNNYDDNENMWEYLLQIGYVKYRQIKGKRNPNTHSSKERSAIVISDTAKIVSDISMDFNINVENNEKSINKESCIND